MALWGKNIYQIVINTGSDTVIYELIDKLILGRESTSGKVDHESIDASHCTLEIQDDVIVVTDHNSKSGTYINGTKIAENKKVIFDINEELKIGELEVKIEKLSPKSSSVGELEFDLGGDIALELGDSGETAVIEAASAPGDLDLGGADLDIGLDLGSSEAPTETDAPALDLTSDEEPPELSLGGEDPEPELSLGSETVEEKVEEPEPESLSSIEEATAAAASRLNPNKDELFDSADEEFEGEEMELDETFEELIEDDESEEEVEKVTFLTKLKKLFKKKEVQAVVEGTVDVPKIKSGSMAKSSGAKKRRVKVVYNASTPVARLMGIGCDLIVMSIVFQIFHRNDDFFGAVELISQNIISNYNLYLAEYVDTLLKLPEISFLTEYLEDFKTIGNYKVYIIVYLLIRFLSTLLLGVSIGQFVMGCRPEGSIIWVRLGGVVRELFGIILLPFFLILDLPAMIGNRTFKEVITMTAVVSGGTGMFWFGTLIGIPLLVVCYFASPLFENLETPKQYNVEKLKIQTIEDKEENSYIGSKLFNLSYYRPNEVIFYPTLAMGKVDGKEVVRPKIRFVEKGAFSCELVKIKRFDMFKLLSKAKGINLLFEKNFPMLNRLIVSDEDYAKKMSRADFFKTSIEYEKLIKTSFELGTNNVVDHIIEFGPFLGGFAKFKELFYKLLSSAGEAKTIKMKNINNSRYLYIDLGKGIETHELMIVPMDFISGNIYKITLSSNKSNLQIDKLTERVLDRIIWEYDPESKSSILTNIDELFSVESDSESMQAINDNIYNYYFKLAKIYYESGNKGMIKIFKSDLKKTISVYEKLSNRDKEFTKLEYSGYDSIIQNLNEVIQALNASDERFFNLEEVMGN